VHCRHRRTRKARPRMRIPAKITASDLREAHQAADTLASEQYRPYLPGRLLPLLVARFRDEVAEALGMELPPLPKRPPVRPAKLSELTSREFGIVLGAVGTLVERFTPCMDDPELPRLLRDLRDALLVEKAERDGIADELSARAKAS
jgi:hypothetical protein